MNLLSILCFLCLFALTVGQKNRTLGERTRSFIDRAEGCNLMCPFQFCGDTNFAIIAERFQSMTSAVCRRLPDTVVRRIFTTRRSNVKLSGSDSFTPITDLTVNGVSRGTFFPNFFTTFPTNEISTTSLSGIGYGGIVSRSAIEGLEEACVMLPIGRWQDSDGNRFSRDRACISFMTFVAQVEVRFTWDSNDDLDLVVVEPDGSIVDFGADAVGFLVEDQGVDACAETDPSGRTERIVYSVGANAPPGRYRVRPRIFENCDPTVQTNYNLKIVQNGVVILDRSGTVNRQTNLESRAINSANAAFNIP